MASRSNSSEDVAFFRYFNKLVESSSAEKEIDIPIRIFDKGDHYAVYGPDSNLVAETMYKSTAVLRTLHDTMTYVTMTPAVYRNFLREALFRTGRKVEVLAQKGRTDWVVVKKGSPGNLEEFEDDIEGKLDTPPIIIAARLSVKGDSRSIGVCFADSSVHELGVCEFSDNETFSNFESLLIQLGVKECVLPASKENKDIDLEKLKAIAEGSGCVVSSRPTSEFSIKDIEGDLGRLIKAPGSVWPPPESSVAPSGVIPYLDLKLAMAAASALVKYVGSLSDPSNFGKYKLYQHDLAQYMRLDSAAVRAVNLMPSARDGSSAKAASLFGLLNNCKTPIGSRLLSQWLHQPLMDLTAIEERQTLVEILVNEADLRHALQEEHLRSVPDLYRLAKKFLRKAANLEDVVRAYQLAIRIPAMISVLDDVMDEAHGDPLKKAYCVPLQDCCNYLGKLQEMVETTLDLDALDRHEFIIKPDFDDRLRTLRRSIDSLKRQMSEEHERVADDLGLEADKKIFLENHKVHGWCFRVTRAESSAIRGKREYREHSTQKNGVYFTTDLQQELRNDVSDLSSKYERMQSGLANEVIGVVSTYVPVLERLAGIIAHLDVITSFAHVSVNAPVPYVRPVLHRTVDDSDTVLVGARHPCLEAMELLSGNNDAFIPNDIRLSRKDSQLTIITGPNMGGKSTYIRMAGVIAVMAQVGCFVPCKSAELRIFDAILARVGAGDAQLRGISTFMAEMLDTASIISSATPNSLILVDELGRGTSTYDGFGLAWAIAEHLIEKVRAFTLFATHFHEVTALAEKHKNVRNLHVVAHIGSSPEGFKNKVTLMYKVAPGIADQSFGIQVAEMVQFPTKVVDMARRRANELEFLAHKNNAQAGEAGSKEEAEGSQERLAETTKKLRAVLAAWKEAISSNNQIDKAQELKRLVGEHPGLAESLKSWQAGNLGIAI